MNTTNPTNPRSTHVGAVRLAELNRYDCWRLVTEAAGPDGIARVVWSGPDGPAIVPVNFTVADGFLWFQTAPGSRLALESPGQQVLVEVDHVDTASHTGWSVVVAGVATSVSLEEDPGILGDLHVWPGGLRELLLRVEPDELTGRRLLRND
jgi:uncharacterized protein